MNFNSETQALRVFARSMREAGMHEGQVLVLFRAGGVNGADLTKRQQDTIVDLCRDAATHASAAADAARFMGRDGNVGWSQLADAATQIADKARGLARDLDPDRAQVIFDQAEG